MRTKTGEKITFKEFKVRFKQGVEGVTPLQISKGQISGTWINIFGMIAGLITFLVVRIKNVWWWASICLGAGLLLTSLSQISNYQKYWKLKQVNDTMIELVNRQRCIICGNECADGLCECLDLKCQKE